MTESTVPTVETPAGAKCGQAPTDPHGQGRCVLPPEHEAGFHVTQYNYHWRTEESARAVMSLELHQLTGLPARVARVLIDATVDAARDALEDYQLENDAPAT